MTYIIEVLQAYVLIYLKSQHAWTVNVSFQIFELPLKKLYSASGLTLRRILLTVLLIDH
jgi:hypothetical protein